MFFLAFLTNGSDAFRTLTEFQMKVGASNYLFIHFHSELLLSVGKGDLDLRMTSFSIRANGVSFLSEVIQGII